MRLLRSITILTFLLVAFGCSKPFSQNISFNEAKEIGDQYLANVIADDYAQCYAIMAPPLKKTVSEEHLKNAFLQMDNMFGRVSHFEYREWRQGVKIYPDNVTQYPMITLVYGTKFKEGDKKVRAEVSVILIGDKLWVSDYFLFPEE